MFGQKSILILADRIKDVTALTEALSNRGISKDQYNIHTFAEPEAFFQRLADFEEAKAYTHPPLLIIFLQTKGFTPLSLLRKIREEKVLPHWPVIGFGSHIPLRDLQAAFDAGLNGFFESSDLEELANAVSELEWLNDLPQALPELPGDDWMQAG